jgi:hypothetical protein
MQTFVCVPFRARFDLTVPLVETLSEQDEFDHFFLYNNGPSEDHYPWAKIPKVSTVEAEDQNLHHIYNQAIETAWLAGRKVPSNLAIFNNDIIIKSDHFLSRLATALRSQAFYAAVSGVETSRATMLGDVHRARCEDGFQGNTLMLKTELPQRFHESYEWHFGETDLAAQWESAGYRLGVNETAIFEHIGGGSQSVRDFAEKIDYWDGIGRDRDRFYERWPQIKSPSKCVPLPA